MNFFKTLALLAIMLFPSCQSANDALCKSECVSKSQNGPRSKAGLSWSPFNPDKSCKSRDQVIQEINQLSAFPLIRIYGLGCAQTEHVMAAAKSHPEMKIFLGIYEMWNSDEEVHQLIRIVNGDWDKVHTVGIGNEHAHRRVMSAGEVADRVNRARSALRAAGYNGPVVTAETVGAFLENPILCQVSDYIAASMHPFFSHEISSANTEHHLRGQSERVRSVCPEKELMIVEVGWPHQGEAHHCAVSSIEDQNQAIQAIYRVAPNSVFLGPFDDLCKNDHEGSYGAEKYWGIQDLDLLLD